MSITQCRRFPYKGRKIVSCPSGENTIVGYQTTAAEVARIKAQWGSDSVNEAEGIVNLFGYIKNDKNNRQDFAGAYDDKVGEGGITNLELLAQSTKDPNFYRQSTGNTTANTTPVNPNNQNTQGGESSTQTTTPTTTTPAKTEAPFLVYPLDMTKTAQDRIKFTAVEYLSSGDINNQQITFPDRKSVGKRTIIDKPVFLPIQASISDQNSADWQGGNLNEIERQAVNLSTGLMNAETIPKATEILSGNITQATDRIVKSSKEIKVALAGEAVSIQNLLGRFGSVLNPNLELLFTGPQLRPFEFQFKLSAREQAEANNIKEIIKFFKKNMAPKGKSGEVFLRAPYTFFIEYQYGDLKNGLIEHPGINKIKECALLNCSVDYTPNGTYMTYQDGTMVSYTMSLSFQELEPIYSGDYDTHPIGY